MTNILLQNNAPQGRRVVQRPRVSNRWRHCLSFSNLQEKQRLLQMAQMRRMEGRIAASGAHVKIYAEELERTILNS